MGNSAVPTGGNDCVNTPDDLALAIVNHFRPTGRVCDPCSGGGAFERAFISYDWDNPGRLEMIEAFDIQHGRDFLATPDGVRWDWIITNEPWSLFSDFLRKGMATARNVVFLDKLNAWMATRSRFNLMKAAGWEFREVALVAQPPPPWPQMGFQFAAVHVAPSLTPGRLGRPEFSEIDWTPPAKSRTITSR